MIQKICKTAHYMKQNQDKAKEVAQALLTIEDFNKDLQILGLDVNTAFTYVRQEKSDLVKKKSRRYKKYIIHGVQYVKLTDEEYEQVTGSKKERF